MNDVLLGPQHGLKQSVDYPFVVVLDAAIGVPPDATARMELRFDLDDPQEVDTLTTGNGRIVITIDSAGKGRVTIHLNGEASRDYPITTPDGASRYRKLKEAEAPTLPNAKAYKVLPLYGTLIVSQNGGDDLPPALDFTFLFEGAYTRWT